MSSTTNLPTPERVLAIAAHPDDIEFECGATLAKWAAAGAVVNHLICTDGSKGTWDTEADTVALVGIRQEEQREAVPLGECPPTQRCPPRRPKYLSNRQCRLGG